MRLKLAGCLAFYNDDNLQGGNSHCSNHVKKYGVVKCMQTDWNKSQFVEIEELEMQKCF